MVTLIPSLYEKGAVGYRDFSFYSETGLLRPPAQRTAPVSELVEEAGFQAVSSYCLTKDGELVPWVRLRGERPAQEAGVEPYLFSAHIELDRHGKKFWSGTSSVKGTLRLNSSEPRELFDQIVENLPVLEGSAWYASRAGLHIVKTIEPLPLAQAAPYLGQLVKLCQTALPPASGLFVDPSCGQPYRLMRLARCLRDGLLLDLPRDPGNDSAVELPKPPSLPKNLPYGLPVAGQLGLTSAQRKWAENFAARWLKNHVEFLQSAMPGTGRNSRLFAFAADIRQLSDVGLIDEAHWTSVALDCGKNAQVRPVHSYEQAISNGLKTRGTGTLAIMLADLEKLSDRQSSADRIVSLLKGG